MGDQMKHMVVVLGVLSGVMGSLGYLTCRRWWDSQQRDRLASEQEDEIRPLTTDLSAHHTLTSHALRAARQNMERAIRALFAQIDTENRGRITGEQFSGFLDTLGLTGDRQSALASVIGLEPDGEITFEGFLMNWVEALEAQHVDDLKLAASRGHLSPQARRDPLIRRSIRRVSPDQRNIKRSEVQVFLGGTCGQTTWRQKTVIPMLQRAGVSLYNPQVEEWNHNLIYLENLMKVWCRVLLFVIGKETRAILSMVEAAQYITEGKEVVLVIEDVEDGQVVGGTALSRREAQDLNRSRAYLRELAAFKQVTVKATVAEACRHIIQRFHAQNVAIQEGRARTISLPAASSSMSTVSLSLSKRR